MHDWYRFGKCFNIFQYGFVLQNFLIDFGYEEGLLLLLPLVTLMNKKSG